jgi:hypothetical protein
MAGLLYLAVAIALLVLARRLLPFSLRAAAALAALPLVFTGSALLTSRIYAPIDLAYANEPLASMAGAAGVTHIANAAASDVYAQFIPWNAALRWAAAHHEWPLWNPFELGGGVLAAAAQSAPYHPFTLLGLLLPQGQALTFSATMLFFFAALTMFLFLRDLAVTESAALFGAAAWAFSMHAVAFMHTAHGNSIAMMPLVLLAGGRVAREASVRAAVLLTAMLILLLLCGHPESVLHVVLLGSAYAVSEMLSLGSRVPGAGYREVMRSAAGPGTRDPGPRAAASGIRHPAPLAATLCALAAGAAALLLTAFFLLPMLDAIPQTREYLHRTSGAEARVHPTLRHVGDILPRNFLPFLAGESSVETPTEEAHGWAGSGYAGALAFVPALYALRHARRRRTWFFAGVVVFGWLMGAETPGLAGLFAHLPLFSIAINTRMIFFASFGVAVLGAIGLDAWLRAEVRGELALAVVVVTVALLAGVVLAASSLASSGLTLDFIRLGATRAVLPLLLAFTLCRVVSSRPVVVVGFILLLLLQRSGEAARLQPVVDAKAFYPPIAGLDRLPRDETQPYRIAALGSLLTPALATHYGLEDVRGYQAMTFARLAETYPLWCTPQAVWSNRIDDLTAPMLSLLNVRYALATPRTAPPAGWQRLGEFPGYQLLVNPAALPRAFIPSIVHLGTSSTLLGEMAKCGDFGSEAWIETGAPATPARPNGAGRVSLRRRGSRLRLAVSMASPGWVVVSEPAWRGWRAYDGDTPLELHFADNAFLAFHLGAGEHDVRMFYRPRSFVTGASVSLAAALLFAGWGILRRRRG